MHIMAASQSIPEVAQLYGTKEESQDSQLILDALRAELGVPSVSERAEVRRARWATGDLQAAYRAPANRPEAVQLPSKPPAKLCSGILASKNAIARQTVKADHINSPTLQIASSPVQHLPLTCADSKGDGESRRSKLSLHKHYRHENQSQTPAFLSLTTGGYLTQVWPISNLGERFGAVINLTTESEIVYDSCASSAHIGVKDHQTRTGRERRKQSNARAGTSR